MKITRSEVRFKGSDLPYGFLPGKGENWSLVRLSFATNLSGDLYRDGPSTTVFIIKLRQVVARATAHEPISERMFIFGDQKETTFDNLVNETYQQSQSYVIEKTS